MAVIGQSHLIWRCRVADHISHANTIVRIVPIEVGHCHLGHSKMELTDVDFSFPKFHWLFESNETNQGYCLTAFGYFKEMNSLFYI